jgi:cell division septal protein FtsQ
MAIQTRKRTVQSKAKTPAKRRRPAAVRRSKNGNGNFANFFVPLFFIFCILFCLGFLGFMGYRTVTASEFFGIRKIDLRGVSRASTGDIEKIVGSQVEKSGVWNADLNEIKERVEKLAFVKTAAVSRILPDGVRVNLIERVPKALVRIKGGDFWVDEEAVILGLVGEKEERPPFILRGWDESKTEAAVKDNQTRVKMYQKMIADWREFDLASRVKEVNLENLQDPKAIVLDSGETISIDLGKENFGKRLQKGLEIVAGRGKEIESVNLSGSREILGFRTK